MYQKCSQARGLVLRAVPRRRPVPRVNRRKRGRFARLNFAPVMLRTLRNTIITLVYRGQVHQPGSRSTRWQRHPIVETDPTWPKSRSRRPRPRIPDSKMSAITGFPTPLGKTTRPPIERSRLSQQPRLFHRPHCTQILNSRAVIFRLHRQPRQLQIRLPMRRNPLQHKREILPRFGRLAARHIMIPCVVPQHHRGRTARQRPPVQRFRCGALPLLIQSRRNTQIWLGCGLRPRKPHPSQQVPQQQPRAKTGCGPRPTRRSRPPRTATGYVLRQLMNSPRTQSSAQVAPAARMWRTACCW